MASDMFGGVPDETPSCSVRQIITQVRLALSAELV
jgi:hypothetical protein